MDTINQAIVDALTQRLIDVGRVETKLRRDIWAALVLLEADLVAALKANDPTEFVLLARRLHAIELLMEEELEPLITTRYTRIEALTTAALIRLALAEVRAVRRLVNTATEDETIDALPSEATVRRAVTDTRIPTPTRPTDASATGEEWWQRQGVGLAQQLRDQLLVSASLEEPLPQMVARVRGTSAQNFRDGLMEQARQRAARLLTTQVTNAVGEAHVAVADVNAQKVVLQHISLRDTKTSLICVARDGKRFTADTHQPIGHSLPYLSGVPYHIK
jgi:hypothetical protein